MLVEVRFAPAAANFTDLFDRGVKVVDKYGKARESFTEDAFAHQRRAVPVVFSHLEDMVVGEVLVRTVSQGWHIADLRLEERYEGSVRVGTPVSPCFVPIRVETPWEGIRLHRRALLREISLLGPGERAAYPGAMVTRITGARKAEPLPKPQPAMSTEFEGLNPVHRADGGAKVAPVPRAARSEMDEFNRRIDAAGPNPDVELILERLREELGYRLGRRADGLWERRAA